MFAIILTYIVIVFAIIGLTFLIEALWLLFIKPKNAPEKITIINLKGDIAHLQLYEVLEEQTWLGEQRMGKIIATSLDVNHDDFIKIKDEYQDKNIIFIENLEINDWIP